jgi:hypothetical protein
MNVHKEASFDVFRSEPAEAGLAVSLNPMLAGKDNSLDFIEDHA